MNRIDQDSGENVTKYLNPTERANYARTSRFHSIQERKSNNQKCLLQTIGGLNCGGIIQGFSIGKECVNYCNLHTNAILEKLINLFFSQNLIAKLDYDEIGWQTQVSIINLERIVSMHITLTNDEEFVIYKDEIYYNGDVYTLEKEDNIGLMAVELIGFQIGWKLFEVLIQQSRFEPDDFVVVSLLIDFHDKEFNIKFSKTIDAQRNEILHIKIEPFYIPIDVETPD